MSYSNSFPTQRPTLNLDFANSGKLDSRISYARSSTGTALSSERHLSSENLLNYSTAFDNAAWVTNNIPTTTGQTDPSGDTGGCILIADTTNGSHNKFQSKVTSGDFSFTVYAKPASGTMRMMLNLYNVANDWEVFLFDLVGGTPVAASGTSSTFSNVSATQTASGNGYYKCTIKATGSITNAIIALNPNATTSGLDAYGGIAFAGDNTAGITVAFASLSTVGSSEYNATTTQIHREYAPTLKTSAANEPRFEYTTDGESEGLLIEASATNLIPYSIGQTISVYESVSTPNAGVGPDGSTTATLVTWNSSLDRHYAYPALASLTSGTVYTGSAFVKATGGLSLCQLTFGSSAFDSTNFVNFSLTGDGSVTSEGGGATGSIRSAANGWYRVSISATATASSSAGPIVAGISSGTDSRIPIFTANSYGGLLCWGWQMETGHMSSFIATAASAATRAADSCSLVSAPLLDNGSGGLTVEYDMRNASTTSYVLQTARSTGGTTQDGVTIFQEGLFILGQGSNTRIGATTSNVFHKAAASWESGSQKFSRDGSAVTEDTTTVVPQSGTDKLHIGTRQDGNVSINGHIRNIAIYSEPLSSTNLTTLSQL